MERDVLRKRITINGIPYEPVILPGILHGYVLMLAHNEQGHNGSRRTYNALRYVYYWKGMKNAVERHCKRCYTCAKVQHQGTQAEETTLQSTSTTNGIYFNGSHR